MLGGQKKYSKGGGQLHKRLEGGCGACLRGVVAMLNTIVRQYIYCGTHIERYMLQIDVKFVSILAFLSLYPKVRKSQIVDPLGFGHLR